MPCNDLYTKGAFMFCGPEENRTLHTFLAREHRQPWYMQAHKPVGREGFEPPYCESNTTIFAQGGFTVHCRYLPIFVLLSGVEPESPD